MKTIHPKTLSQILEKGLGDAVKFKVDAAEILSHAHARGYLRPSEIVDLLIPTPFVGCGKWAEALETLAERLKEVGISIVSESIEVSKSPPVSAASAVVSLRGGGASTTHVSREYTADELLQHIARSYSITMDDLLGVSHERRYALPRQLAMYLLRKDQGESFPRIATILKRANHTTIIHGFRHIARLYDQNATTRADVEKIRTQCRGNQTVVTSPDVPNEDAQRDTVWERITRSVLTAVGSERNFPVHDIIGKSKTEYVSMARHIAVYLLQTDFTAFASEITPVFGIKDHSTVWHLTKKIKKLLNRDALMAAQVERIRSTYTLAWYDGKIEKLLKRQQILFAGQIEEAVKKCASIEESIRRIVSLVTSADIRERSREIFLIRYGLADDSYTLMTLDELGKCYDNITRERVRQILRDVWNKLRIQTDLPIENAHDLEDAIVSYTSWLALIKASGPSKH